MARPLPRILALAASLLALALLGGCGTEEEGHAVEGEALEVDGLSYNVQITRFLNPADAEDRNYLAGQEPAPQGQEYLGVFMRVESDSEQAETVPDGIEIRTSRGNVYEPVESESPFALQLGSQLEPGARIPAANTPAASGPIKGAMLLFLVDDSSTENRPLELEIPGRDGEAGKIELDL
jgi:hypothetical protein